MGNLQIGKELEKKRLERQSLTFEQHSGNLTGKHRRSLEGEVGAKRKNELLDGLSKHKKLKVFEHIKAMDENREVVNEGVAKSKSEVNQEKKPTEEGCQLKISSQGKSRERMSLVSEKGCWFLKSAVSASI